MFSLQHPRKYKQELEHKRNKERQTDRGKQKGRKKLKNNVLFSLLCLALECIKGVRRVQRDSYQKCFSCRKEALGSVMWVILAWSCLKQPR